MTPTDASDLTVLQNDDVEAVKAKLKETVTLLKRKKRLIVGTSVNRNARSRVAAMCTGSLQLLHKPMTVYAANMNQD